MSDSNIVTGIVLRRSRARQATFVWCWSPPDLVQVVLTDETQHVVTGALIRTRGTWAPSSASDSRLVADELHATSLEVLQVPSGSQSVRTLADLHRLAAMAARNILIDRVEVACANEGIRSTRTPPVRGASAAVGPTSPFAIGPIDGMTHGYLPVNNIVEQYALLGEADEDIFELSHLYWQHRSSDPSAVAEIVLLELATRGRGRDGVIALMERLLEDLRATLLSSVGRYFPEGRLREPLVDLPRVRHSDVVKLARARGHDPQGHVLSRAIDDVVAEALGNDAYWLLDAPADHVPYYAQAQQDGTAISMELRLRSSGDAGSGSVWTADLREAKARALAAELPDDVTSRYLSAVGRGIDRPAGMSLGLDRLLLYFLGLKQARTVVPTSWNDRSVGLQPPAARLASTPVEVAADELPPSTSLAQRNVSVKLDRVLRARGLRLVQTSRLQEAWALAIATIGAPPLVVDFFERALLMGADKSIAHHRLLLEHPSAIFEWHTGSSARWWKGNEQLSIAFVAPSDQFLEIIVDELLRSVLPGATSVRTLCDDAATAVVYAKQGRFASWYVDGVLVARSALWPSGEDDAQWLRSALLERGSESAAASAAAATVRDALPAGGATINVEALAFLISRAEP